MSGHIIVKNQFTLLNTYLNTHHETTDNLILPSLGVRPAVDGADHGGGEDRGGAPQVT